MFATWPMVFGALTAGVIAGMLLPENQDARSNTVAAVSEKSGGAPVAPKTKPEVTVPTPAKKADREAPMKNAQRDEACEKQTWPYLTPSCLDRSAPNPPPAVMVKTRTTEPPTEVSAREKQETKPPKLPAVAATTNPAKDASPQKTEDAQAPKTSAEAPKRQAAQETEEWEEAERPRAKLQPARRAAEPRRGPDRNRSDWRYAGRDDFDDQPRVFIQRGGRLYLAPEHRHHLRPQAGYWREW